MARSEKKQVQEKVQEAPKPQPVEVRPPLVSLSLALTNYQNKEKKELLLKYMDSVKAHLIKVLPSMEAPMEEWHKLFDKF
jgi:hypothetical protein